jgi:UDP-N-acetylglucosamine 2-epimerase (hydrolysing)
MKTVVFLTGTRADFGKQKSLIQITNNSDKFNVHLCVTGMHLNEKYGFTVNEILESRVVNQNVFCFENDNVSMDKILAKTILGFSNFISKVKPDLIVVHGDRVEALAGAIVGSLNNILVAHIEGGEKSGTIDEIIRHSVSKMSHLHFVSNTEAKNRLIQMGENDESTFIIGSPDIDLVESDELPSLQTVRDNYFIDFDKYSILLFHPVTTELDFFKTFAKNIVSAVIKTNDNFVVSFPNNDNGCEFIFSAYEILKNNSNFKIFPSIRFEYFLVLLKNSEYILGNSSAGVIEAPYYGVPTVNVGSRQNERTNNNRIIHCGYDEKSILEAISKVPKKKYPTEKRFGTKGSDLSFLKILENKSFWETPKQKTFNDLS